MSDTRACQPQADDDRPHEARVRDFSAEGGAAAVVRDLVIAAGLAETLAVQADAAGSSRAVSLDLEDATLREAFVLLAAQAHLDFVLKPDGVELRAAAAGE